MDLTKNEKMPFNTFPKNESNIQGVPKKTQG